MRRILTFLLLLSVVFMSACTNNANKKSDYKQIEKTPIRMIRVDGELYYDSGEISNLTPRCGTLDGNLTKTAIAPEIPKNDNECNFECAKGFQIATSISKEVLIDGDWVIFKKFERDDINLSDFEYCFYIKGRLPNAAVDTEIVVISEDENISFGDVIEPMFSSQFNPSEKKAKTAFVYYGIDDEWGIKLTAKDVTNKGLTLECEQFGNSPGEELTTGSVYFLEKYADGKWESVETILISGAVGWNDIAYIINKNEKTEWKISWEWHYGELEPGTYRIGKNMRNFKEDTRCFEEKMYYAQFVIE